MKDGGARHYSRGRTAPPCAPLATSLVGMFNGELFLPPAEKNGKEERYSYIQYRLMKVCHVFETDAT